MASRILAEKTAVWKVDGAYHETYEAARKALIAKLVAELLVVTYNDGNMANGSYEEVGRITAERIDAIIAEAKEALDKVPAASLSAREV